MAPQDSRRPKAQTRLGEDDARQLSAKCRDSGRRWGKTAAGSALRHPGAAHTASLRESRAEDATGYGHQHETHPSPGCITTSRTYKELRDADHQVTRRIKVALPAGPRRPSRAATPPRPPTPHRPPLSPGQTPPPPPPCSAAPPPSPASGFRSSTLAVASNRIVARIGLLTPGLHVPPLPLPPPPPRRHGSPAPTTGRHKAGGECCPPRWTRLRLLQEAEGA